MKAFEIIKIASTMLLLGACQHDSSWTNLNFEADAVVDGRIVHANTIWRTKFIETFPSGGRMPVSGVALAIPVSPGRFIYGLFKSIDGNMIGGWGVFATGLDVYVMDQDKKLGRPARFSDSRARFRDYAAERLNGRPIQFCLPKGTGLSGQDRCPMFVYFANPSDPNSVRIIRPGQATSINGHTVRISNVMLTFDNRIRQIQPSKDNLPSFLRKSDVPPLGKLPKGLEIDSGRQLHIDDFWRE